MDNLVDLQAQINILLKEGLNNSPQHQVAAG